MHRPLTKDSTLSATGKLRRVLVSACKETGYSLADLTVLSVQVDPYRLDTPAGHRDGKWAAALLKRLYGGVKTCELLGLVGWHNDTCYLLNSTKPISLQMFRAQYIEIGQQALIVCIVTAALLVTFVMMYMLLNSRWMMTGSLKLSDHSGDSNLIAKFGPDIMPPTVPHDVDLAKWRMGHNLQHDTAE